MSSVGNSTADMARECDEDREGKSTNVIITIDAIGNVPVGCHAFSGSRPLLIQSDLSVENGLSFSTYEAQIELSYTIEQ